MIQYCLCDMTVEVYVVSKLFCCIKCEVVSYLCLCKAQHYSKLCQLVHFVVCIAQGSLSVPHIGMWFHLHYSDAWARFPGALQNFWKGRVNLSSHASGLLTTCVYNSVLEPYGGGALPIWSHPISRGVCICVPYRWNSLMGTMPWCPLVM